MSFFKNKSGIKFFQPRGLERLLLLCFALIFCARLAESSYLPTVGSNIGIGTSTPVGGLVVMNGNVGIGTWSPTSRLQVVGTVAATAFTGDGSALTGLPASGGWTDGGTNVYTSTTTDNVGIGTTTPASTLTLLGNIGIGTTLPYRTIAGPNNGIIAEGNVGIGTWNAAGGKLVVRGVGTSSSVYNFTLQDGTGDTLLASMDNGDFVVGGPQLADDGNTAHDNRMWFDESKAAFRAGNQQSTDWDDANVGNNSVAMGLNTKASGEAAFAMGRNTDAGGFYSVALGRYATASGDDSLSFGRQVTASGPNSVALGLGSVAGVNPVVSGTSSVGIFLGDQSGQVVAQSNVMSILGGNVGIGTTAVVNPLVVSGAQTIGSGYVASTAPTNGLLVQGNVGVGTTTPVGALTVMNGNVGIGTWSPTSRLQVVGTVAATAFTGDGSGLTGIAAGGWTDGGTNVYTTTTTDNVGIGTTTPASTLTLLGNIGIGTTLPYRTIAGPNNGMIIEGNVGIGTWAAVNGQLIVMNGNVGIGTTKPSKPIEFYGTSGSDMFFRLRNTSLGGSTGMEIFDYSNIFAGTIGYFESNHTAYPGLMGVVTNTADIAFITGDTYITPGKVAMIIKNGTNNVGIGTSTPVGGLTVMSGNVGIGTWSPGSRLMIRGGNVGIGTTTQYLRIAAPTNGMAVEGNVGIGTWAAASGKLIVMGGNVGIGTTVPSSNLTVAGTDTSAVPALFVSAGSLNVSGQDNNGYQITLGSNGAIHTSGAGQFSATTNMLIGTNDGDLTLNANTSGSTGNIIFQTVTNVERARMVSSGNFGLGTTAPVGGLVVMNGNVGIGTWSPTQRLQVVGTVAATAFSGDGSALTNLPSSGGWTDGGTNVYTSTTTDNVGIGTTTPTSTLEIVKTAAGTAPLMVSTTGPSDGDYFIVSSSGSVGIGTTIPGAKLDIVGAEPQLRITPSAGQSSYMYINKLDDTKEGGIIFQTAGVFKWNIFNDNTNPNVGDAGDLKITGTLDSDGSPRIHLPVGSTNVYLAESGGNVGIGTSGPVFKFEVSSNASAAIVSSRYIASANGTDIMGRRARGTSAAPTALLSDDQIIGFSGSGYGTSAFHNSTGQIDMMAAETFTDTANGTYMKFSTTSLGSITKAERVRIDPAGNIGVGTTTPGGALTVMNGNVGIGTWSPTQRLQVVGTVAATAFSGDGSALTNLPSSGGWTDGGTNVYTSTTTDYVGIGTTTPTNPLTVVSNDVSQIRAGAASGNTNAQIVMDPLGTGVGVLKTGGAFDLTFQTNSAEKMRIQNSNGNVGIGTTAPLGPLHVSSANSANNLFLQTSHATSNANGIIFKARGADKWVISNDWSENGTQDFTIFDSVASSTRFFINSAGNIGIGTTTPVGGLAVMNGNVGIGTWSASGKLIVMGGNVGIGATTPSHGLEVFASGTTDAVIVRNTTTSGWSNISFRDSSNVQVGNVGYGNTAATTYPGIMFLDSDAKDIGFFTGIGTNERMRILSGGNIGIGTPLPLSKLVVNGGVGIGTSVLSAFLATTAPSGGLIVENNVGIGTTSPVGALTVMNGNVGIGTWSPTQRLQVVGTVAATAFSGDGSALTNLPSGGGWTDGGTNVYASTTTDAVAIGTTTPLAGGAFKTLLNISRGKVLVRDDSNHINELGADSSYLAVEHSSGTDYGGTINVITSGGDTVGGIHVAMGDNLSNDQAFSLIGMRQGQSVYRTDAGFPVAVVNGLYLPGPAFAGQSGPTAGTDMTIGAAINGVVAGTVSAGVLPTDLVFRTSATSASGLTDRMRITSAGNVGIGTSKPVSKFVVNGGVGIGTITSSAFINTAAPSGGLIVEKNVGIGTTSPVGALTVMNGNVGIGTWSPISALEVKALGSAQITINGASGGCLMFRDTDNAGWTECNALNGILTCSLDADGVCDGS